MKPRNVARGVRLSAVPAALLTGGLFVLAGISAPSWAGLLSLVTLAGIAGLYQRLRGGYVLGNRVRRQTMQWILQRPGMGVMELALRIGVRRQTVTYHLNVLADFGLVGFVKDGAVVRAFPTAMMSETGRPLRLVLERRWARDVVHMLQKEPETSERRLAARMGVSRSTARWYVQKLQQLGILTPDTVEGDRQVVLSPAMELRLVASAFP